MNINSDDPFQVLGMEEPTSDKKVIKRAYKRMALKYHPDVATTKDSSAEEKKAANAGLPSKSCIILISVNWHLQAALMHPTIQPSSTEHPS